MKKATKKAAKKKRVITICASASFNKQVIEYQDKLQEMGFKVLVPITATKMKREGNYDVMRHKKWYKDPKAYNQKNAKMRGHLRQVEKGDAIFVVNLTKKGVPGYVGGNTLLEIFRAWQMKKPIYVLNRVSDRCGLKEEVLGLGSIFIDGDLTKIK